MSERLFAAAVAVALVALLAGARALQRAGLVGAEAARKLVHVGMGAVALSLPWILSSTPFVVALATAAAAALLVVRVVPATARSLGPALHDVGRASIGDLLFPFGVAATFAIAHDDRAAYCGAIGALALADTAGALVGARFGRRRFTILGSAKSLEGSTAVFAVAALCSGVALAAGGEAPGSALGGALVAGAAAAAVEAIAGFGLDNLLLPVAVAAILRAWRGDASGATAAVHALAQAAWLAAPVLLAGLLHVLVIRRRWLAPLATIRLDGGATWRGRPLFGANKTLRGALVMPVACAALSLLQVALLQSWAERRGVAIPWQGAHPAAFGALAGLGYVVGELPNSLVKRQLDIAPGETAAGGWRAALAWAVDQVDSVAGFLLFVLPVWTPPLAVVGALLLVTLLVHPLVALIMVGLGLKNRVG